MKLNLLLLGTCLLLGALLWLKRSSNEIAQGRIRSLTADVSSLRLQAVVKRDTMKIQLAAATRWRTAWDTIIRVDTLEATDTVRIPVRVLVVADSTIRSCSIALTTCQELAALERARADSAEHLAELWRKVARGPFLRPSAELLFSGSYPRAAAQLEAGRRLSAVARLEIDTLPRFWAGLHYQF